VQQSADLKFARRSSEKITPIARDRNYVIHVNGKAVQKV
jgi:hypothetical protein